MNLPAMGENSLCPHNCFRGIVPAFHKKVRLETLDQICGRVLTEKCHGIDKPYAGQQGSPVALMIYRP